MNAKIAKINSTRKFVGLQYLSSQHTTIQTILLSPILNLSASHLKPSLGTLGPSGTNNNAYSQCFEHVAQLLYKTGVYIILPEETKTIYVQVRAGYYTMI